MNIPVPALADVHPRLLSYIGTRDRRVGKHQPWSPTPMSDLFAELIFRRYVKVGGRASCGGAVDPTWVQFTAWGEIVKKAIAFGYQIEITPVKHGNAWATKAGGFWNENEYRLPTPQDSLGLGGGQ